MTIKHDRSVAVILTKCSECGDYWWSLQHPDDMDAARRAGDRHELDVHDREPVARSSAARQARYRARKRHAEDSSTVTSFPDTGKRTEIPVT